MTPLTSINLPAYALPSLPRGVVASRNDDPAAGCEQRWMRPMVPLAVRRAGRPYRSVLGQRVGRPDSKLWLTAQPSDLNGTSTSVVITAATNVWASLDEMAWQPTAITAVLLEDLRNLTRTLGSDDRFVAGLPVIDTDQRLILATDHTRHRQVVLSLTSSSFHSAEAAPLGEGPGGFLHAWKDPQTLSAPGDAVIVGPADLLTAIRTVQDIADRADIIEVDSVPGVG